tara:strand:+ start:114229 stop:114996 length:768 start_codon:yes stop_codon:yes gene_type:complete
MDARPRLDRGLSVANVNDLQAARTGTSSSRDKDLAGDEFAVDLLYGGAPIKADQEWANAVTHGIAAALSLIAGVFLIIAAADVGWGMAVACGLYVLSVTGTFLFSTLSHIIHHQPMLNTLRAWDQAMIYAMISGTYTPIAYGFATDQVRMPLLVAIWIAALAGFYFKVGIRHRVNSIGTWSYVLLGWLPAIPLVTHVPSALAWCMTIGGVVYSLGIICLVNDSKIRYLHAVWHLFVMAAAAVHFFGIFRYVVLAG